MTEAKVSWDWFVSLVMTPTLNPQCQFLAKRAATSCGHMKEQNVKTLKMVC